MLPPQLLRPRSRGRGAAGAGAALLLPARRHGGADDAEQASHAAGAAQE